MKDGGQKRDEEIHHQLHLCQDPGHHVMMSMMEEQHHPDHHRQAYMTEEHYGGRYHDVVMEML
jgi:hypothetical protein